MLHAGAGGGWHAHCSERPMAHTSAAPSVHDRVGRDSSAGRASVQTAAVYRMVTPEHVCPYGIKSKWILEREGFRIDDHILRTREEADAFKRTYQVETTPQTFIDGTRIGGYDDLRLYFGKSIRKPDDESYQPVVAVFGVAALAALALHWAAFDTILSIRTLEWFVALSMALLAMLKLQDVRKFSTMFVSYDLLAQRWVPYSFIYPFAEAAAAILMLAHVAPLVSAPLALFIGGVGATSVIKTVWFDHRQVKCACVGGSSTVPLGFVSLTENLAMVAMGGWTLLRLAL